ncbi:MAG: ABC-type cobalamin/Fe(3+)-siderophores transport system ATPase component [Candidatus Methanohalarchaeum thermophilum]|uniref:ABC-type cobalamin/Fe(3+)-siderophores transport system ATPase component n=1 Tax=Methanohalarchaeum thermophilum TaxID=1903181 RepID=A0A1Q6DSJ6_METT1|nr:MAG: ABC-type cobalamin/Fe(3+)-siderophores transport system ATPase component [Candidatus Methanohalarchaeum thermophilum]
MKLQVKDIKFSYNSKSILNKVNFKVKKGEIVGILGPNGSGKTTLLKCINKNLKIDYGSVYIQKQDIKNLKQKQIAEKMGYVPQEDANNFPSTVFDTVLMGRRPHSTWRPSTKDKEIVTNILEKIDLKDQATRDINELSGGQRQKALIARALAQQPEILIFDEPTSSLDVKHQLEVLDLIKKETKTDVSAIMAIHDINLASKYCDKFIFLKDGEILDAGGTEVINQENIRKVYGVEAEIKKFDNQKLIILKNSLQKN